MSKTFISIGAGPGIGLATAVRFAKEGFSVVLTSRSLEHLKALAAEFEKRTGAACEVAVADASKIADIRALAEQHPDAEVVHFNAAIVHPNSFESAEWADLEGDILAGVTGGLAAIKAFAPLMAARGSGALLGTGGILSEHPCNAYWTLGVAKAAVANMFAGVFNDLKAKGVHAGTVTVTQGVAPGSTEAETVAEAFWRIYSQPQEDWAPMIYDLQ